MIRKLMSEELKEHTKDMYKTFFEIFKNTEPLWKKHKICTDVDDVSMFHFED